MDLMLFHSHGLFVCCALCAMVGERVPMLHKTNPYKRGPLKSLKLTLEVLRSRAP